MRPIPNVHRPLNQHLWLHSHERVPEVHDARPFRWQHISVSVRLLLRESVRRLSREQRANVRGRPAMTVIQYDAAAREFRAYPADGETDEAQPRNDPEMKVSADLYSFTW